MLPTKNYFLPRDKRDQLFAYPRIFMQVLFFPNWSPCDLLGCEPADRLHHVGDVRVEDLISPSTDFEVLDALARL